MLTSPTNGETTVLSMDEPAVYACFLGYPHIMSGLANRRAILRMFSVHYGYIKVRSASRDERAQIGSTSSLTLP